MISRPRWEPCISHRGASAESFVREYFGQEDRRPMLIAGAGFDPRSTRLPELLATSAAGRTSALLLRERRPAPRPDVLARADANERHLRRLIPGGDVEHFDIFDIDSAPVGGRRSAALLDRRLDLAGVTDLVLDCSALSIGVIFPVARYCYERARASGPMLNFHLLVLDDPKTDAAIGHYLRAYLRSRTVFPAIPPGSA